MNSQKITFEDAISGFPQTIQANLRDILLKGGVIPSELVLTWLDTLTIEIEHLMILLLPVAAAYARVPISDFQVGAVALGRPPVSPTIGLGNLYLGSNMDFSGESLSSCIHGEQSAVNNAWLHGETGLQALAINASPCGHCRQFLYELTTEIKGLNIILKANKGSNDYSYTTNPLTYYLPDAFSPEDLGVKGSLMKPEFHNLKISGGGLIAQAALDAANASYSPYTKNYSGVALLGPNSVTYTGRYAENAAYNPSMSPMESALAFMNMNLFPQTALDISEAVLVEAKTNISQEEVTRAVLSSVAPTITLNYFSATK